jgi:hypothetical protein
MRFNGGGSALDCLLRNVAKELQSWAAKKIGNIKAQLLMAKEVILQLDRARDRRDLSLEEIELQQQLKGLCLGLASLARIHHHETKI